MKKRKFVILNWRRRTIGLAMCLLPLMVIAKAFVLQTQRADRLINAGNDRYTREFALQARRGMIFDRNQEPLAVSARVFQVFVDPAIVEWAKKDDAQSASSLEAKAKQNKAKVEEILGLEAGRIDRAINDSKSTRYTLIAKQIRPNVRDQLRRFLRENKIRGLGFEQREQRFYPAAEVASSILGLTNIDSDGIAGFEQAKNDELAGHSGKVVEIAIGARDKKQVFEPVRIKKARSDGDNLNLTLDMRLQHLAYRELKRQALEHKAKSASLVALNVHNGEILAMASWPSDNPNEDLNKGSVTMVNRPVQYTFEPGSTVKPLTMVAALESKKYAPSTRINTAPGRMKVDTFTIRDVRNYGTLDLSGILKKSSNVGAAKIAIELGVKPIWGTLDKFGLGHSTNLSMPYESTGRLRPLGSWYQADLVAAGYGYGLSTTLLQMARAYAALGNGGVLVAPKLVLDGNPPVGSVVTDKKTAKQVVEMMRGVVGEGGTATRARVLGYSVAGKTGTTLKQINGVYRTGVYQSLFVGLIPAMSPELVVAVMVDEPASGDYYGGVVAGPVFARFNEEAMHLLNIQPDVPAEIAEHKKRLELEASQAAQAAVVINE